jgi:hypothetical protein
MRGKTPNKPLGKAFMDNMSEIDEGQKDEHEEDACMAMFSIVPRPLSACGLSVVNKIF